MPEDVETVTVALHEEMVQVERGRVATARVRVRVRTRERPRTVDEMLTHERVEVTRVPVGRTVAAVPPVREEDGVTIIPVVEEVLVLERRLVLKEEVRLKRVKVTEKYNETVMLREQHATVDRVPLKEEPFPQARVAGSYTQRESE